MINRQVAYFNADGTPTVRGIEYFRGLERSGGGSSAWGSIGGTLADQTDLQAALNGKQPATPLVILGKTSSASQNVGGANGTEVFWTWDTQVRVDTGFTHSTSTNPSRIEVNSDGWYEITFVGNAVTTGASRSTLQGIFRINGGTTSRRGTVRSYTRGSSYGNLSPQLFATVELTAGDYIELGSRVEDTDGTYTINTSGAEIDDDSHFLQIKKAS